MTKSVPRKRRSLGRLRKYSRPRYHSMAASPVVDAGTQTNADPPAAEDPAEECKESFFSDLSINSPISSESSGEETDDEADEANPPDPPPEESATGEAQPMESSMQNHSAMESASVHLAGSASAHLQAIQQWYAQL